MVGKVDYGMLWNILKCMNVKNKKDLIPLCSNCHALVHRLMIKYDNPIERLMVYYKNNNLTHASTL